MEMEKKMEGLDSKVLKEYIEESMYNGFDDFSEEEVVVIERFLKDMILYSEERKKLIKRLE